MYLTLLIILMFGALLTVFIGLFVKDKKISNRMMVARVVLQASVVGLLFLTFF